MRQVLWLAAGVLALAACSEPKPQTAEKATPPTSSTPATTFDTTAIRVLTAAQLPAGLARPAGNLVEAREWTDANGLNLLLVTRTAEQDEPPGPDEADDARHVELYARQYVRRQGKYELLWKLQDNVSHCPFDLTLDLLPGSTTVTDLDGDGQTETTLLYLQTCTSDVSPLGLKLIMHEGAAKYALRGNNVVQYDSVPRSQRRPATICCLDTVNDKRVEATGDYGIYAGRYENEKEFRTAPPAFLAFAQRQWRRWSVRPDTETD